MSTVPIPQEFLVELLRAFISGGQEHARTDKEIERSLRDLAAKYEIEECNIDLLVKWAFGIPDVEEDDDVT